MEIWKPLDDYAGIYEISSLGKIKSILKDRILIPQKRNRYLKIDLTKDKITTQCSVHRLVAKNFIPNPDNKPYINHKDNDRTNNNFENLEWVTPKENSLHAKNIGLYASGVNHKNSVLTKEQVKSIRDKYIPFEYPSRKLATEFGVSQYTIMSIVKNKTWKSL